jgi:hypothetical protein
MNQWETFERDVLDDMDVGDRFTCQGETSKAVQRYLRAQRRKGSRTRYVLSREGRTRAAVWTIGTRAQDTRRVVGQFGSDVACTMRRAVRHDLDRMVDLNPRQRALIEAQLTPLLDGMTSVIDAMLATVGWTDEN